MLPRHHAYCCNGSRDDRRFLIPGRVHSCLKVGVVAQDRRDTSSEMSSEQRGEDQFEKWGAQVGIKAPKLRHHVFKDDLVGELR